MERTEHSLPRKSHLDPIVEATLTSGHLVTRTVKITAISLASALAFVRR